MANYKNIYVSHKKIDYTKKKITIDEDLCKIEEDDAIENYLKSLSGTSKEDKEKYDNGEKITIYLYTLSKDNIPYLYKSLKVEKDGDDYKTSDEEEFDVPDDFVSYDDKDDDDDDSDKEDESDESDEEDSEEDDDEDDKKEDKDDEDDKEDDVREVEEACDFYDKFFDLYEAGVISDNTMANLSILLEEVVGRKTVAQLKETKKKETKDRRLYLKAHSHYMSTPTRISDKEKEILSTRTWDKAWDKENKAKNDLEEAKSERYYQRVQAYRRLKEANKERRSRELQNLKDNIKDKVHSNHPKKPVTVESMMIDMNREAFMEESYSEYVLMEAAIIAASTLIYEDMEYNMDESISYNREYTDERLNELEESGYVNTESEKISLVMIDQYMTEKTLKSKDRKALDDKEFGIPETRSYPMPDKVHVRAAIMMFNKVDPKYEKTLAKNIIKAMRKFDMMSSVKVGKNNRFKQYLDAEAKEFNESFDITPFPPTEMKEFAVGSMLPTKVSWGEGTDEDENVSQDIKKYATHYDEVQLESVTENPLMEATSPEEEFLMYESIIPQHNITFDKEVEKLMQKLKEFVNNPKNDYLETILKKALNYKKTVYTIHLKEQKGEGTNKVISKILSCGFKDVKDEGVKCIYDKETHGILITLVYDTVSDKIRITYENVKERPKMESSYLFESEEAGGIKGKIQDMAKNRKINAINKKYSKLSPELKEKFKSKMTGINNMSLDELKVFLTNMKSEEVEANLRAARDIREKSLADKEAKKQNKSAKPDNIVKESVDDRVTLSDVMELVPDFYTEKTKIIESIRTKHTKFGKYTSALENYYMSKFKEFIPFDQLTEEVYRFYKGRYYTGEGELSLVSNKEGRAVTTQGGKLVYSANSKPVFECEVTINLEKGPGYVSGNNNSFSGKTYTEIITCVKNFTFKNPVYKKFEIYYKAKFYLKYDYLAKDIFETLRRECIKLKLINNDGELITEASKEEIDDDIKPIIDILNKKGYNTKYSCSGHLKARVKEDGFRNGIMNGKLYTTARIVFDKDYDIGAPKGWKVKTFDGQIGIYPEAPNYSYNKGMPDDAWEKWKHEYMAELKIWANGLGDKPGPEEDKKSNGMLI